MCIRLQKLLQQWKNLRMKNPAYKGNINHHLLEGWRTAISDTERECILMAAIRKESRLLNSVDDRWYF